MNKNRTSSWNGAKRWLAIVTALALWLVSMRFSRNGFAFEYETIAWVGWALAAAVTVIELVFNTEFDELNPTLIAAGIVAYGYGIYTNVTGIYLAQNASTVGFWEGTNWLIPLAAGLMTEVIPEALFVWGIGARGDLVGKLSGLVDVQVTRKDRPGHGPKSYG